MDQARDRKRLDQSQGSQKWRLDGGSNNSWLDRNDAVLGKQLSIIIIMWHVFGSDGCQCILLWWLMSIFSGGPVGGKISHEEVDTCP